MKNIVNLYADQNLIFQKWTHGKYSCESAEIGSLWNTQKLGFHIESLDPGAFSCPYHFHHQEEELFIALKGSAMVRQDDEFYEIKEGDLVWFKTGSAHQFYNHTDSTFLFFALSNKSENEVCEYPDSKKRWSRKDKKLLQNNVEVSDYFLDEENPNLQWPEHLIKK